jgi:selenide,water dikinase
MHSAAGSHVTGGQTVLNPWPIIGGVATSVCADAEIIRPVKIVPGCVLVLTKALGTQVAVNVRQWINDAARERAADGPPACVCSLNFFFLLYHGFQLTDGRAHTKGHKTKQKKISLFVCRKKAKQRLDAALQALGTVSPDAAFLAAEASMIRLNRAGARLMREHGSLGATDVTGFGLLGHATNLASNQDHAATRFIIDKLPVIASVRRLPPRASLMFDMYCLWVGAIQLSTDLNNQKKKKKKKKKP